MIAMSIRVKICCISSIDEAWLAIKYGASALGLVSEMPSGPGIITEDKIAAISVQIPPFVTSVLLTSKRKISSILAQHEKCQTNAIQICDEIETDKLYELRRTLPGIDIIQVIHITGEECVSRANLIASHVDALLLDSGNPSSSLKELGGTGQIHDWSLSRKIRDSVQVPVILAGGLNPSNVANAVSSVQPFAVDVCSGVRTCDNLDENKLKNFFRQLSSRHASI
jgi:phosphoribosylanthranilate isomerase